MKISSIFTLFGALACASAQKYDFRQLEEAAVPEETRYLEEAEVAGRNLRAEFDDYARNLRAEYEEADRNLRGEYNEMTRNLEAELRELQGKSTYDTILSLN